jgi:hypothetical protein
MMFKHSYRCTHCGSKVLSDYDMTVCDYETRIVTHLCKLCYENKRITLLYSFV